MRDNFVKMVTLLVLFFLTVSIVANPHHEPKVVIDKILLKTPVETFKILEAKPIIPGELLTELLSQLQPREIVEQNLTNSLTDQALGLVQTFLVESGFTTLTLPEEHADFHYWLIINYYGGIDLTNGQLEDFTSIHRAGNVVLIEDEISQVFTAFIPLEFDDLLATYDYWAEIMGLGPSGGVIAYVRELHVELIVSFDAVDRELTLLDFQITGSGHIDVVFTGNSLVDWLLDLLANAVTAILKSTIWNLVDNLVDNTLRQVIEEINVIIKQSPTSASSTSAKALQSSVL